MLTPSTILSACPGDEVVLKCYEPGTTYTANESFSLRWKVNLRDNALHMVELPLSNLIGENQMQVAGVQFYSKVISYSPLTSILMTTAHPLLNLATVMCITTASETKDTLIIMVLEIMVLETGNQLIY